HNRWRQRSPALSPRDRRRPSSSRQPTSAGRNRCLARLSGRRPSPHNQRVRSHYVSRGFVSLVGAGPGDPGLLTLAGRDRLAQADVVVYDRLIGNEIVAMANPDAEMIFAGKEAARQALRQDEINELLVAEAS